MPSVYLPDAFDANKTVAIIAGKSNYPQRMAERMQKAGIITRLIGFEGETKRELIDSFPEKYRRILKVGQLGKLLHTLQDFDAKYAVMAGQITPGKLFRGLHPDLKALNILSKLKERNAETLFGAICQEIDSLDIRMLDARAFMDEDMAENTEMTGIKTKCDETTLQQGIQTARLLARENIGQGLVISRGTILAVEAFEGTDAMLKRAGQFKAKHALFVKTINPQQDTRFDIPLFGFQTLETMKNAGIENAALEANNVLILDKQDVLKHARKDGIRILGF